MIENKNGTWYENFNSISEFYKAICERPINSIFRWASLASNETSKDGWHGTSNFEEATELLKNGSSVQAEELTTLLKVENSKQDKKMVVKSEYNVCGYQASVPRYLQGIPQNMVCQKRVPQKQKVITINKDACYASGVSTKEIEKQSMLILRLIQKIEAQGIKVNLNLIYGFKSASRQGNDRVIVKVRIKSAGERLNISKLAFPLVNSAMQRRLFFRYLETFPNLTDKKLTKNYGAPLYGEDLKVEGETLLPKGIFDIEELIKQLLK